MTADERAALVERLRADALPDGLRVADLIEADGKRLALAEAAIADAPHGPNHAGYPCPGEPKPTGGGLCNCWKADYDAAKEAAGG